MTARKTEERLQDVPLSISVLSRRELATAGIDTFAESISHLPNVAMSGGMAGLLQGQLGIRGISTLVRNPGVETGVGIYIDGVYIGRPDDYAQELIDVAQIEVLRGPQGTLFGKNTIAGVFNITTLRPGDRLQGDMKLEVGNYGLARVQAVAMGPLVEDKVAAKLSVGYVSRDGVYKNLAGGPDGDGLDMLSWRGGLYLTPTERLHVDLVADGLHDRGNPAFFQAVDIAGHVTPMATTPLRIENNRPDFLHRDNYGFSGTAAYDLDGATITAITAYRRSRFLAAVDDDQSQLDLAAVDRWTDTTHIFSQELRANGTVGDRLNYVVGAYYFHQKVTTDRIFGPGPDTGISGYPVILTQGSAQTRSFALFGTLTWRITDRLSLDAGLRWTDEHKHAAFTQGDQSGIGGVLGLPALSYDDAATSRDVSPTVSLSYRIAPTTTLYARYATGFKSASFNIDVVSSTLGLYAGPEKATTYEIGLKTLAPDRKLSFNLALFDTEYNNMQVSQLLGAGVTLDNAGRATIRGAEAEAVLSPLTGLKIEGSLGYLDARYDQYDNCPVPASLGGGVQASCAGNRIIGAPRWTWHVAVEHSVPTAIGDIVMRVDYSGQSRVYFEATNAPRFRGDARNLIDGRLGLRRDEWEFFLWGKNLTNRHYITYSDDRSSIGVLKTIAYGDPRTVGLSAARRF